MESKHVARHRFFRERDASTSFARLGLTSLSMTYFLLEFGIPLLHTASMAHKKAGGSTTNGRDSRSKRHGVKLFGGEKVRSGGIIIRQKGSEFRAGQNAYCGRDFTIHAEIDGVVNFSQKQIAKFNGRREKCTMVHVVALAK